MKEALKRFMGLAQTPPAQAAQTEEEVTMTDDVTQPSGAQASAEVEAALQATVASLTEQLAAANEKIAELAAFAEAAAEFKAAQEKATAEAKIAARTAKLVGVVGTVQAASLQVATASMDDAAFEAVVTAMTFKSKTEESSPAFKEVGVEGGADAAKLASEAQGNRVMDYLQAIAKENKAQ